MGSSCRSWAGSGGGGRPVSRSSRRGSLTILVSLEDVHLIRVTTHFIRFSLAAHRAAA